MRTSMLKRTLLVVTAAILFLCACGGGILTSDNGATTKLSQGGAALTSRLGNSFLGNYVKIKGTRSSSADGKYPCQSAFEQCLPLEEQGSTPLISALCPSEDTPEGTWNFEFTLYTDENCSNQLANLTCEPITDEVLELGPNVNNVECWTRVADKSFDLCVVDPITGAGRENCPDALREILILEPTVEQRPPGHPKSSTQLAIEELGFIPVIVTPEVWANMTTADFSKYRAIVLADALDMAVSNCWYKDASPLAAAETNTSVWGPAVTGNIIVMGTDPTYHAEIVSHHSAYKLIKDAVNFSAWKPYQTGLYLALGCYYVESVGPTRVKSLDYFGDLEVSPATSEQVHIVGSAPALSDLTDADLSSWVNSIHEIVDKTPGSAFQPFAISLDYPGTPPCIIAKGLTP